RVNYEVENMRVGDRTDFNRLRILIETNGTISPREALEQSIEMMIHQLKSIIGFQESAPVVSESGSTSAKESESSVDATKIKIADLELSARITSALEEAGIKSAAGLARKSASSLKELDGIGEKAIEEISGALAALGLTLKS